MNALLMVLTLFLLISWYPVPGAKDSRVNQLTQGWTGVVKQTRSNTCGPALLAMLLNADGTMMSELAVAELAVLSPAGMSLAEFGRLATQLGYAGAWYAAGSAQLSRLPKPFVAHLEQPEGHFVLLEEAGGTMVRLSDPVQGRITMRSAEFRRLWSGRAWFFNAPAG